MAFCENCGKSSGDDSRFCPYCGQAMDGRNKQDYSNNYGDGGKRGSGYDGGYYDPRDIEDNRGICILNYFGPFLLIPLLLRPNSPYIRFHANQGIILLIVSICVSALSRLPLFGWLFGLVGGIFTAVCVILGIINSLGGHSNELPIVGSFRILN